MPSIAVAFVLVAGLLLWFVIGSRGPWPVKLTAIVVACAFTFAVWRALDSFSGWPTEGTPPDRAVLLASSVDEPDSIYVWVIPFVGSGALGYRPGDGEPRAYRIPYTRELHEQVDLAARMAERGQQVELRAAPPAGLPQRRGGQSLRVYRLPAPSAPRKHED